MRFCAALLAAAGVLAGCAQLPPPVPVPERIAQPVTAGVLVRYFEGVLVLPADYVFDGTALPDVIRFQGPQGALRLGRRAELEAGSYLAEARRTLRSEEELCGLTVLAHGEASGAAPTRWLLLGGDVYALIYDQDPAVVRMMLRSYCATRNVPAR